VESFHLEIMPNYKLTYFDARGLAEPSRWIFAYAGVPYEDVRIPMGGLTPELKKEMGLDWGQLPTLEIDGAKFAQSRAIARYLAKKYNLFGKDEIEEFRCNEIIDAVGDYTNLWLPMFREPDETKKAAAKKDVVEVQTPIHFERFNKVLQRNGTKWSVGNQFTVADIYIAHFLSHFETAFNVDLQLKYYPALNAVVQNVHELPAIKEWIAKRPQTNF